MCKHCSEATRTAGKPYMCRPCWRRYYRNAKKVK